MICLQTNIFWAQNLGAQKIGETVLANVLPCLRAWSPVVIVKILKVYIFVIYLQFFKENIRYPVWTSGDSISLIQGTWWQFVLFLGTRFSNLGTRIWSLTHLKKTCASNSAKLGLRVRNNNGVNARSPWTAQVTSEEISCGSAPMSRPFQVFEPCRCAPGMSHILVGQIEATGE